jgi:hypothetical protein
LLIRGLQVLCLVLGPLLLARVKTLPPAPGGIVVSPTAPKLDLRVVIDAPPDDPRTKPLVATLTGQRPQPSNAPDARAVVTIEPDVQLSSPEALDRLAAELEHTPAIAVHPWHKTTNRYEAMSLFFVLLETMSTGAFSAFGLRSRWTPTGLVARRDADRNDGPLQVYGGGHIVAERRYPTGARELVDGWTRWLRTPRASNPIALALTLLFLAVVIANFVVLVVDPSWANLGWYAATVFAVSLSVRRVGMFARASTLLYPVPFICFLAVLLRAPFVKRPQ